MAYLTLGEAKAVSMGIDMSQFPDADVLNAIGVAEETIFAYTGVDWNYRTVRDEVRRWRGDFSLSLNYRPRVIQKLDILTGVSGGQRRTFTINATPVETTPSPDILPLLMGDIAVNHLTRSAQGSSLLLSTGAIPLVVFQQAWTICTYTTGYDLGPDAGGTIVYPDTSDGLPQTGDGFTRPFPNWIKKATLLVLRDVMGEYQNARRGMTGLLEVKVGNTTYRRPLVRPKIDYAINPLAKQILDRHHQVWAA